MSITPPISYPRPSGDLNSGICGEEAGKGFLNGDGQSEEPLVDMIYEILRRLPVKTLCRFKCVSKPWYSLISHHSFQKDHYRFHSQRNPHLLVVTQTEHDNRGNPIAAQLSTYTNQFSLLNSFSITLPEPTKPILLDGLSIELFGSCLGLVCLGTRYDGPIMLCNPSTQDLIALPQPLIEGYNHCVGFGYGISTHKLKVVRYVSTQCEVLTLGSADGWKKSRGPPYQPCSGAPLLHGALHLRPLAYYVEGCDHYIAAFDMDAEDYRRIPLPEIYSVEAMFTHDLVVISGALCLSFEKNQVLELWLLRDYNCGKWVKEYNINFYMEVPRYFWHHPVASMADGSIVLNAYNPKEGNQLCRWNTEENICMQKITNNRSAILYVESFFSLGTEVPGMRGEKA